MMIALFWLIAQITPPDSSADQPPEVTTSESRQQAPPLSTANGDYRLELGLRTSWVQNAGYQPFLENSSAYFSSLGISRVVLNGDRLALALGVGWEAMTNSTASRGAQVTLNGDAFSALVEGRYHFLRWLYGYARLRPAASWQQAEVADGALASLSEASQWGFSFDSTAGVACLLFPQQEAKVHAWLAIEAGYGWTTPMVLALTTQTTTTQPLHGGVTDLGRLSFQGPIMRATAALSF